MIKKTNFKNLFIINHKCNYDNRGQFFEIFRKQLIENELDYSFNFCQENLVNSSKNVLRGLHFQKPPSAQAKLVRCGRGAIFDVALDIRKGSPTYGQWEGYELTAKNGHQLYVPVGFAHGFVTLVPNSEILYKCTDYYAPDAEGTVRWDSCGIEWPLSKGPILSDKDAIGPALADFESPFVYGDNP